MTGTPRTGPHPRLSLAALLVLCGVLPGLLPGLEVAPRVAHARGQALVHNPLMDDMGRSHKPSMRAAGKIYPAGQRLYDKQRRAGEVRMLPWHALRAAFTIASEPFISLYSVLFINLSIYPLGLERVDVVANCVQCEHIISME